MGTNDCRSDSQYISTRSVTDCFERALRLRVLVSGRYAVHCHSILVVGLKAL